jgi:5-methyltetrahydrofolate--homocysteine methyltransferase
MSNPILESMTNSLVELDFDGARRGVQQAIEASIPPQDIIKDGLARGMEIVGKRFEAGEYFLAELITAGAIMEEVMKLLEPHLKAGTVTSGGKVVVGTVQGDLHDVGKNILISMLKSAAFEVTDLGVDVPPEKFVEKVKEVGADIVCLSALLSVVVPKLEETAEVLKKSLPSVKILIGGRCVDEKIAEKVGVMYAKDAWAGTRMAVSLMKQK